MYVCNIETCFRAQLLQFGFGDICINVHTYLLTGDSRDGNLLHAECTDKILFCFSVLQTTVLPVCTNTLSHCL